MEHSAASSERLNVHWKSSAVSIPAITFWMIVFIGIIFLGQIELGQEQRMEKWGNAG